MKLSPKEKQKKRGSLGHGNAATRGIEATLRQAIKLRSLHLRLVSSWLTISNRLAVSLASLRSCRVGREKRGRHFLVCSMGMSAFSAVFVQAPTVRHVQPSRQKHYLPSIDPETATQDW